MGTAAHVVVVGDHERTRLDEAERRIADLERRWSRFLPDSEVSRMNARVADDPLIVSSDTLLLVQQAVRAWQLTRGFYDPTVLPAVRAIGYDADFSSVLRAADDGPEVATQPSPGCAHIDIDPVVRSIRLLPGVEFDPGGIGKGLAADVVTAELLAAGARGALVNIGGDLRARGEPPETATWSIGIADPIDETSRMLELAIADGAVATSSSRRRRWTRGGRCRHHIVDPRTGDSSASELIAVTVVASDGWWAEAAAKAIFVAGTSASRVRLPDVVAMTVTATGSIDCSPELAALVS